MFYIALPSVGALARLETHYRYFLKYFDKPDAFDRRLALRAKLSGLIDHDRYLRSVTTKEVLIFFPEGSYVPAWYNAFAIPSPPPSPPVPTANYADENSRLASEVARLNAELKKERAKVRLLRKDAKMLRVQQQGY